MGVAHAASPSCLHEVAFRVLAANNTPVPDHLHFRKDNVDALSVRTYSLCQQKLGHVALDGTKVKGKLRR